MGISLLEHVEPYRIADTVWGEAYERTGALKRSRLKQTIALNSAILDTPARRVVEQVALGQGGEHAVSIAPCDWSLVLVGNEFADPTSFLAAAIYPALIGVRDVMVLRESGPLQLPESFLSGLELAGLENFGECGVADFAEMVGLAGNASGHGAVLALGAFSPEVEKALCEIDLPVSRLGRWGGVRNVHVMLDGVHHWDWECLAWAFPRAEYMIAGKGADEVMGQFPKGMAGRVCHEGKIFSEKCDLLLHPAPLRIEESPAPVCLGPGQEGVWVWPRLHGKMFQYSRLYISS